MVNFFLANCSTSLSLRLAQNLMVLIGRCLQTFTFTWCGINYLNILLWRPYTLSKARISKNWTTISDYSFSVKSPLCNVLDIFFFSTIYVDLYVKHWDAIENQQTWLNKACQTHRCLLTEPTPEKIQCDRKNISLTGAWFIYFRLPLLIHTIHNICYTCTNIYINCTSILCS